MKTLNDSFYLFPTDNAELFEKLNKINCKFTKYTVSFIGRSLLEKPIYSASIGNLTNPIVFVGGVHAQEWLTCKLLVYFLERICNHLDMVENLIGANPKNLDFLNNGVIFIPMLNPDGVEIALKGANSAGEFSSVVKTAMKKDSRSWQANARGVDLNHNFDAGFDKLKIIEINSGITSPSPRQYGGEFANSEPETKAIVNFLNKINPRAVFAFHSQGEEIFYEYGDNTPTISYFVVELYRKLSGYRLAKNDSLYSHGGLKDYCIEKLKIPSFTIEIGKGENPLPLEDLLPIYEKIEKMLVAMLSI